MRTHSSWGPKVATLNAFAIFSFVRKDRDVEMEEESIDAIAEGSKALS